MNLFNEKTVNKNQKYYILKTHFFKIIEQIILIIEIYRSLGIIGFNLKYLRDYHFDVYYKITRQNTIPI
jgi:hypothetical protein